MTAERAFGRLQRNCNEKTDQQENKKKTRKGEYQHESPHRTPRFARSFHHPRVRPARRANDGHPKNRSSKVLRKTQNPRWLLGRPSHNQPATSRNGWLPWASHVPRDFHG